jgi:hypothetical protein
MWFFGIGTATRRDLRLAFGQEDDGEIEPWMIEQVSSRVALSSTALAPRSGWFGDVWAETTVAVRSIPLVGGSMATALAGSARHRRAAGVPPVEYFEPPTVDWPLTAEAAAEPPTAEQPTAPAMRPVPGWAAPTGGRSVLSPRPGTDRMPEYAGTRSGSHWDQDDWAQRGRVERNEARASSGARVTNRRSAPFGNEDRTEVLVPVAGDEHAAPLPRRNARVTPSA